MGKYDACAEKADGRDHTCRDTGRVQIDTVCNNHIVKSVLIDTIIINAEAMATAILSI